MPTPSRKVLEKLPPFYREKFQLVMFYVAGSESLLPGRRPKQIGLINYVNYIIINYGHVHWLQLLWGILGLSARSRV